MGPQEEAYFQQITNLHSPQKVTRNNKSGTGESSQLLAENPLRAGLEISNHDPNNRLYIAWGEEDVSISEKDWSFPIEPQGTYQDSRGFNIIPRVALQFQFENGAGDLTVTEFKLDLPRDARKVVQLVRQGNARKAAAMANKQ